MGWKNSKADCTIVNQTIANKVMYFQKRTEVLIL